MKEVVGAAAAGRMDLLGSSLRHPPATLKRLRNSDRRQRRQGKLLPLMTGALRREPFESHTKARRRAPARRIPGKPTDRVPWAHRERDEDQLVAPQISHE